MGESTSSSSFFSSLGLMRLLLGLVFLGWLLIWVMIPTNTYRNDWSPKIRTDTNSTYFGRQGTNILIFTFPILFIAVLGCFYVHLKIKKNEGTKSGKLSRHLDVWRRPVLVKGPLGIVSALELGFFLMFIALLIWAISMYVSTSFARINAQFKEEDGEKLWEVKLESVGLRLGLVGNICFAFLFFPVTRMSSLLPLVGLTSDSSINYHIWLGHIVMVLFTAHGLCYIIFWISTQQISQMIEWSTHHVSNVAGEIALLAGLILWVTTYPRIRRKMFELFLYAHHFYILFLVFFLLHVGISFFTLSLPGVYLFVIDRYLRFLQSRRNVGLISARLLPSETVELNFSKSIGFSYTPASIVFINVASISKLQWHPFTVTSSSNLEPGKLSVLIKKEGSWTQKLYRELAKPSLESLDISVEGPYGPASVDFQRHDTIVMVSGGSGIAPFISIIRELIYQSSTLKTSTPKLILICIFKTSADLTMLDLLLPSSSNISDLSGLQLNIEAYITREQAPGADQKINNIRTVWPKPNPSHVPFAPVLGPNSWLWLAVIISSSFVAFLLVVGLVTRYHMYPIEQRAGSYSVTYKALLNLLFMCTCIAAASSAAVLMNKKRNSNEAKQVHITDASTPQTSPSSWFYSRDRELESVPEQSLVQATKIHFGGRPNLKKMLLEVEGSSVGAMVSGPSGLRRDVATICSSGLGNNLHYESISFSW